MMTDEDYMKLAFEEAQLAEKVGEVPVGAILVYQGKVIARGFNQPISSKDPTAHAEIQVIRQAANALDNYRLNDTTLYVTLEPCLMCLGAMLHARITRLVYGAADPKVSMTERLVELTSTSHFNHQLETTGGVLDKECSVLLKTFFKKRR